MSNRDVAFVALGRLLVVERYRETHLLPSTRPLRSPGVDRTRGHADEPQSTVGFRAAARPEHG
jgi:hypothetical protein